MKTLCDHLVRVSDVRADAVVETDWVMPDGDTFNGTGIVTAIRQVSPGIVRFFNYDGVYVDLPESDLIWSDRD